MLARTNLSTQPVKPSTMSSGNIFRLSLLSLAASFALPVFSLAHSGSKIAWAPCGNNTIPRECGTFEVPLDYKNAGAGKSLLAVARINATKTPRLGTLFMNPGGPGLCLHISGHGVLAYTTVCLGGSGVEWILSEAVLGMNQGSGGQYDIVSEYD